MENLPAVSWWGGERSDNRFAVDLNGHSATKLEYDHHSQRGQKDFNTLAAQFSFAF